MGRRYNAGGWGTLPGKKQTKYPLALFLWVRRSIVLTVNATTDSEKRRGPCSFHTTPGYVQCQYMAFIPAYQKLHRVAPAEQATVSMYRRLGGRGSLGRMRSRPWASDIDRRRNELVLKHDSEGHLQARSL